MSLLPNSSSDLSLREKLKKQLRHNLWLYRACQGIGTVLIPLLEAFIVNYLTGATGDARVPWIIVLCMVIAIHLIVFAVLISAETPLPGFLLEFEAQAEKILDQANYSKEVDNQLEKCVHILEAIRFNSGTTEILQKTPESFDKSVELIMTPWIRKLDSIWDFKEDTIWNVAIYGFESGNANSDHMSRIWRTAHPDLPQMNREWKKGIGHIGRCWLQGEVQISPPGYHLMTDLRRNDHPRPEDDSLYKSIVAAPIKFNEHVMAVLVITSSEDSQFNEEHGQNALLLSKLLAQGCRSCTQGNLFALAVPGSNNVNSNRSRTPRRRN